MTAKLSALSRNYKLALEAHLERGAHSTLTPASRLGRQAVALGLETLDLAGIHERAMVSVPGARLAGSADGQARAQVFFTEAIGPIERTHAAASIARLRHDRLTRRLQERTEELLVSRQHVREGVSHRKAAEQALRRKNQHYAALLKESKTVQQSLRTLLHRALAAQEAARGQMSRELHDGIAQELLGINARLLAFERAAAGTAGKLLRDLHATQHLVEEALGVIRKIIESQGHREE